MTIDKQILQHLLYDDDYTRQVLPYLEPDYFRDQSDKLVFELASKFVTKYNKCPTIEALQIDLDRATGIHNNIVVDAKQTLLALKQVIDGTVAEKWLVDATERFCQEQAIYRAVAIGASIVDGKSKQDPGILPKLLQDALAVSFDKRVGHNYLGEAEARWEYYHNPIGKIAFDIDMLNTITDSGVSQKTLNVLLAPVNTGKTLMMCHMAAANLAAGKKVLYITLEMSEEEISKRIDANLLDIDMNFLKELSKEQFVNKINKFKQTTRGELIVKEFATKSAHVGNFRYVVNELWLKQKFKPDIIYVDYINNTKDQQGATDLYTQIKNISEDLRGLAVELIIPIISATQVNRDGIKAGDIEMEHVSESMGLPQTVDFLLAVTLDKDAPEQYLCKIIKTRYGSRTDNNKFFIGVDFAKQRLYNLAKSASSGLINKNAKKPKPNDKTVNKKGTLFDDVE